MKTIAEMLLGGDGGKAGLYVDGDQLAIEVKYPLAKILDPVNLVIDGAFAKLEAAIPGDWDKAVLDPIRDAAKAELLKLIAE